MRSVLIAPHSDDEALFAGLICIRYKPQVIVVTDSFVQYERGQKEITAHRRRDETRRACEVMGVEPVFLGLADDCFEEPRHIRAMLSEAQWAADIFFVPALQGGNRQHNLCSFAFNEIRTCERLVEYSTYAKGEFLTPVEGFVELVPTPEEIEIKERALRCYESQAWQGHMEAVRKEGYREWVSRLPS